MSVVANVAINVDAANAIQQLNRVKTASQDVQGGFKAASAGAQGLGTALTAALGPLLTVTAALAAVQKGLNVAFERGAAEQRLRNLTGSTEEFNAAMALASESASKFGITQTDASKALADVYGRLKGVGFGLQETGQIYQGFNAIALQSGLAGEEAAGAFFQLSQALGKGKLNGDEFVIVAERMPQLLDAIAQTTGRSRGELTQMAQDGKITSQVLYEALSDAATASDNLNGKLTAQQQTFNNLRQVTDNLLNILGQVFAPVVVAGAEGLAKVGQMMVDWYGYLGNVIFPRVQEALQPVITSLKAAFEDINFDAIRVAIQNILIKGFEIAIGVISNFSSVLSIVIDGFKALSQNPVFQFIAEQVGRLAGFLGLTNDKVGQFKEEQNKAAAATADTVKNYSSLPPVVEDAKKKQKELNAEFEKAKSLIQDESALKQQQLDNAIAIANANKNVSAEYELQRQKADEIQKSKVLQLDLELQAGKISREQYETRVKITAEQKKGQEIAAQTALAQSQVTEAAKSTNAVYVDNLTATKETLQLLQTIVSADQTRLSTARARGDSAGAILTIEQNILENKIEQAKAEAIVAGYYKENQTVQSQVAKYAMDAKIEAAEFAFQLSKAKLEADGVVVGLTRAVDLMAEMRGNAYGGGEFGGAYNVQNLALQQQGRAIWDAALKRASSGSINPLNVQAILTQAEQQIAALQQPYLQAQQAKKYQQSLQELQGLGIQPTGATPSYAQSYMASTMARSTAVNPQVNISTGPVMQMDGMNYVTMNDLQQATSAAARQGANLALNQLQTNPTVRRQIGVAR